MPIVALIEIQADDVSQVREHMEHEDCLAAFYELVGHFNVGVIVEVENEDVLFDGVVYNIRRIPGVHESRTHLIQDGVVI